MRIGSNAGQWRGLCGHMLRGIDRCHLGCRTVEWIVFVCFAESIQQWAFICAFLTALAAGSRTRVVSPVVSPSPENSRLPRPTRKGLSCVWLVNWDPHTNRHTFYRPSYD